MSDRPVWAVPVEDEADQHQGGDWGGGRSGAVPWEDIGGHIPAELTATGHNHSEAFLS